MVNYQPVQSQQTTMTPTTDYSMFENVHYPYCADIAKYEKVAKIGQGTFG
jgi:hypothetical protein